MTSVCGHVMSIDFPGKFNNWDKVNITEISLKTFKHEKYIFRWTQQIFFTVQRKRMKQRGS